MSTTALLSSKQPHFLDFPDSSTGILGGCDRGHLADPSDITAPLPRCERAERAALCRMLEGEETGLGPAHFFDERRQIICIAAMALAATNKLATGREFDRGVRVCENANRAARVIRIADIWKFPGSASHELREIAWAGERWTSLGCVEVVKGLRQRRVLAESCDAVSRWARDLSRSIERCVVELRGALQEVVE